MFERYEIFEKCLECKVCPPVEECEFLKRVCEIPKELAEKFSAGYFKEHPRIPYSCNLCDLCERLCPQHLNIGKLCLEIRQQMVKEGLGPLKAHQFVKRDQEWSRSESFTLSLPDTESGECHRVFFPGCNLSAYSPTLVLKTYDYLRAKLPGTGIMLRCCGDPSRMLGEEVQFEEMLAELRAEMEKLGTLEIITACPLCYRTFKAHASWLKLRFLSEVLLEIGIPEDTEGKKWTFSLHDSCSTRWEGDIQESVRALVKRMGYAIEEMKYSKDMTRCCGMGGMALYADMDLVTSIIKHRAEETSRDILTYCAACREALAMEKPSLHILDLMFNPEWEKQRLEPPKSGKVRRENQALLRSQLIEKFGTAK